MNLLSGTTWKGAKLRIGEAKPDFRERYGSSYLYGGAKNQLFFPLSLRIKRENETPPSDKPTKKRRLARGVQGVHASDMSLVTPENASSRSGWNITPMGRIVHPIRIRWEKPLPPISTVVPTRPEIIPRRKNGNGKRPNWLGQGGGLSIRRSEVHNV